jgi:predicted DNA-binding protein
MFAYMKRTSIWIDEGQLRQLHAVSEKTGAPIAFLIRKAIEEFLKKRKA